MRNILDLIQDYNITQKLQLLTPYFPKKELVLDYGCGDLSLAHALKQANPYLTLTGIDVVDTEPIFNDATFVKYDGKKLPFKDNYFDTVLSYYVFHHCDSAEISFKECLRVAKKRVIFVEAISRYPLEIYLMRGMDWLYNVWKSEKISLTYQFFPLEVWKEIFKRNGVKKYSFSQVSSGFLSLLPIGKGYIFEVYK